MAQSSKSKGKKTGGSRSKKSSEPSWNRKNKGVIFAIIAVGVLLIVAAFCCVIIGISKEGSDIKTISDFKTAVTDKRALNCLVTQEGEGEFLLQTNKDFEKVKIEMEQNGEVEHMLMLKDDATYIWNEDGEAYKMKSHSIIDDFIDNIESMDEEEEDADDVTIKCSSPRGISFKVPTDVNFSDLGDMGL